MVQNYKSNYRPQQSWGRVIFSVACVKNSVHGGSTWAGTPPPPGRYIPQAGTSPRQVHPRAGTHPPGQVHTPPGRYTPWAGTPPARYYEIRSMSGRYASYWNAFLLILKTTFDVYLCTRMLLHIIGYLSLFLYRCVRRFGDRLGSKANAYTERDCSSHFLMKHALYFLIRL